MELMNTRVVVAEDDRFLRQACEAGLPHLGLTVLTAGDRERAVNVARSQPLDLILLDLQMPKLSGIEVLRVVRSEATTRSVRVVILTNSSQAQDANEARQLGIDVYHGKTNRSLETLGNQVGQLLFGE